MNARTRSLLLPAVLALVAALVAVLAPAASAADYPPPAPKATVSGSPKAGGSVMISGVAKPMSTVVVTLDSQSNPAVYTAAAAQVLGTTTAAADGAYSLSVTIPTGLSAGAWFLTVAADGEVLSTMAVAGAAASADTVAAAPGVAAGASPRSGAQGGQLPVTGSTTSVLLLVGVGLVVAGGSAMAYARTRGTTVAAA